MSSEAVAWCLITSENQIINGVHEERRLAEQYRHRYPSDALTALYTKQQIDKATEERDILIRDLRKELNERRYGRSANK